MRFDRLSAVLELIRWQGRGLRGEYDAARGLFEACSTCSQLAVPSELVAAGLTVLEKVSADLGFDPSRLEANFPGLHALRQRFAVENRRRLESVAEFLEARGSATEDGLLLVDLAVLVGIYSSVAAFPARMSIVGLPGADGRGHDAETEHVIDMDPGLVVEADVHSMRPYLERWSKVVEFEQRQWRIPCGELMVVLLAARTGDSRVNPLAPTLPSLVLQLKSESRELDRRSLVEIARGLDVEESTSRGLGVALHLFPELRRAIAMEDLSLPRWEKSLAVPVAARRVMEALLQESVE